jgi:hypothetical protein
MLDGAGCPGKATASQGNHWSAIPSHRGCDAPPSSHVGEHEVANSNILDWSVSGGGEYHGSRNKARPARNDCIHETTEGSSIEL